LLALWTLLPLAWETDAAIASVWDGDSDMCKALLWFSRAFREANRLGHDGQGMFFGRVDEASLVLPSMPGTLLGICGDEKA